MKINTESTKFERLRIVIGSVLAFAGVFILVIMGSFYGYTNALVWALGLLLVVVGVFIAKSPALIQFLQDITR